MSRQAAIDDWCARTTGLRAFLVVAAISILTTAALVAAIFGVLTLIDPTWSCPGGGLRVDDAFGFQMGCTVGR